MNDLFILIAHVTLSWITLYVPDDETRYIFGWVYCAIICVMYAFNFSVIIYTFIDSRLVKKQKALLLKHKSKIMKAKKKMLRDS